MNQKPPGISVVILCFNEGVAIGDCVQSAISALSRITSSLEVIVVDDGSSDNSREILDSLGPLYPQMKLIPHHRNMGYGRSLATGIQAAANDYVLCVDGDNQFSFDDAEKLLALAGSCEVVSGCRTPRADPWYRRFLGKLYNESIQFVFGLEISDIDCGFKLIEITAARKLFPTRSNFAAWAEVAIKAQRLGLRCGNVVVNHRARQTGKSAVFNARSIATMLREVASMTVRFTLAKFSTADD
jgi:glycosyltransferase involved in cell wall biosynthesis